MYVGADPRPQHAARAVLDTIGTDVADDGATS
eukprot:COSAG05_NODE_10964_length_537_cov_0.675799_1_plen_31_part_10